MSVDSLEHTSNPHHGSSSTSDVDLVTWNFSQSRTTILEFRILLKRFVNKESLETNLAIQILNRYSSQPFIHLQEHFHFRKTVRTSWQKISSNCLSNKSWKAFRTIIHYTTTSEWYIPPRHSLYFLTMNKKSIKICWDVLNLHITPKSQPPIDRQHYAKSPHHWIPCPQRLTEPTPDKYSTSPPASTKLKQLTISTRPLQLSLDDFRKLHLERST